MPIDQQTRDFLEKSKARGAPSPADISLEAFRAAVEPFRALGFDREDVALVTDLSVPREGGARDVAVRFYRPDARGPIPVMVWVHGGSWVRVSVDLLDGHFRVMANKSQCAIAAVDYRLSPEAQFPEALEEVYAASRWLKSQSDALAIDPDRIGIGGESSGGNIAAATALLDRERREVDFACQVLMLPVLDLRFNTRSWRELGQDYLLTQAQLEWALERYAPGRDRTDPQLSPVCAGALNGLPPAIIRTGEFDPLKDDGAAYARMLREADISVSLVEAEGLIHHALMVPRLIDKGRALICDTATAFGALLNDRPQGRLGLEP